MIEETEDEETAAPEVQENPHSDDQEPDTILNVTSHTHNSRDSIYYGSGPSLLGEDDGTTEDSEGQPPLPLVEPGHVDLGSPEEENNPDEDNPDSRRQGTTNRHDPSRELAFFLSSLKAQHGLSINGMRSVYQFFCKDRTEYVSELVERDIMPSFKTLLRRTRYNLPRNRMKYTYKDEEGELHDVVDAVTLPQDLWRNPDRLVRSCCYTTLEEIWEFLKPYHSSASDFTTNQLVVDVSSDGVVESNNGRKGLHVVSVTFKGVCHSPMPVQIWEFSPGYTPDMYDVYNPIVQMLEHSGCQLHFLVIDGKETNIARGMQATNSFYGCARCTDRGTTEKYKKVYYPLTRHRGVERTRETFLDVFRQHPEVMNRVLSKQELEATRDIRMGIAKYSPLLDLQLFDFMDGIPFDIMHSGHLGTTKKILTKALKKTLVFNTVDQKRLLGRWEALFKGTRVTTEMRHKCHDIILSKFKAAHFQVQS